MKFTQFFLIEIIRYIIIKFYIISHNHLQNHDINIDAAADVLESQINIKLGKFY